jgi:predicted amidohydrolase
LKLNVVAVQPRTELADFESADAFRTKVRSIMERGMAETDASLPSLVCFPEYLGESLAFVPHYWEELRDETKLARGLARILAANRGRLREEHRDDSRAASQQLLFVEHAIETETTYMEIFSELARQHGAYVVAGSVPLPPMDESPHRGGRVILDDSVVHNVSHLFSPQGVCLRRTAKANIPPGEDRLIDAAPRSQLAPVRTAIGSIGTLLCWDGYHHGTIEQLDAAGAQLIAQPLYFGGPEVRFDGSGRITPKPFDFVSLIQGRENIRIGVGSFMTGAIFEDRRAEGLSFIARNTGRAGTPWQEAILAVVEDPYSEAVVARTLDLEDPA